MSFPGPKLPSRLRSLLRGVTEAALDLIYPKACAVCQRTLVTDANATAMQTAFCDTCAQNLPWVQEPYCACCGEMFDGSLRGRFMCSNCDGVRFGFDFATSACPARDEVREMIHRFKYERQLHLRRPLALLLGRALEEKRLVGEDLSSWLLVPVPLYASRELEREYNQSWEICTRLSSFTGIPAEKVLDRTRETPPQARLTRSQRHENLRGAFSLLPPRSWRKAPDVRGRRILLVDDVFTTGATTSECARVLKKQGEAEKVVVITVARG